MTTLKARVHNGRLLLDEPCDLPEGSVLELVVAEDNDDLDDEEREALHRALSDSLESLEAGEGIPAEQVIKALREKR